MRDAAPTVLHGVFRVTKSKRYEFVSRVTCGCCEKHWNIQPDTKTLLAHARNHVRDGILEELPGDRFKPRMR